MSVLIKGMDMPKEGGVVVIYKEDNSFYTTKAGEGRRYPLIHVSPHGRLINADALKVKFTKTDANGINLELDRYALKCIETAPTIIEAEEE